MDIFIKRLKSFLWRAGMVAVVAGLNWVSQNLGLLELPMWAVGISGLVLGEISKYLNTK